MDDGSGIPRVMQKMARHYEISVGSSPRQAPAQSLTTIVKAFAAASEKGEAVWRRSAVMFEIARVRLSKSGARAVMLLRYSDTELPGSSAHLVINLTGEAGTYRAMLEEAPRLTKARLEFGMEGLTRRLCEFYTPGPRGQFKKAHPRLSFSASEEPAAFVLERPSLLCEPEIRADVSLKLDTLLKHHTTKRAA